MRIGVVFCFVLTCQINQPSVFTLYWYLKLIKGFLLEPVFLRHNVQQQLVPISVTAVKNDHYFMYLKLIPLIKVLTLLTNFSSSEYHPVGSRCCHCTEKWHQQFSCIYLDYFPMQVRCNEYFYSEVLNFSSGKDLCIYFKKKLHIFSVKCSPGKAAIWALFRNFSELSAIRTFY